MSPATLQTPALDHAGLTCADLTTSLGFYQDLLGLPLLDRGEGPGRAAGITGARVAYAKLDAGHGQVIELLEYRHPRATAPASSALPVVTPGAVHVALRVADLDRLLEQLRHVGIRPLTAEPVVTGAGAGDPNGARLVYVLDPDQHVIELVQLAANPASFCEK
jgi:catechol 2,3-dioxygenase-like lactoylglutathione lyase family enzyme